MNKRFNNSHLSKFQTDLFENNFSLPSIYIHFPFCSYICPFCAFSVIRDDPQKKKHDLYLKLLQKEIQLYESFFSDLKLPVQSIYLGGGTPSRMSLDNLQLILGTLKSSFYLDQHTSISMELNPEDCTLDYIQGLKEIGITRISLGIQSFSDISLKKLNRIHSAEECHKAISALKKVGFEDINLDFMFGFPEQSLQDVTQDLEVFLQYSPTHISTYCLNIEEKSKLYKIKSWNNWIENNESLIIEMYLTSVEFLTSNGFEHYEVSNFCQPTYTSKQNILNWGQFNYLGLGISANGMIGNWRIGNVRKYKDYEFLLEQKSLPYEFCEPLENSQKLNETLILKFRQPQGFNLKLLAQEFKITYSDELIHFVEQLSKKGYANYKKNELSLTPKGLLLADEISLRFSNHLGF